MVLYYYCLATLLTYLPPAQVLGNNARLFRRVFDGAQTQLRQVFGMEMSELPVKEKRTLKDRQSRLCLNLFLPQIRIRLTIFQRGVR